MSDHKAETERLIKFAEGNGSESAATAAVATATPYLAEQQKRTADELHLANLIAFADSKWESGGESIVTNKETVIRVRMLAYEGLGLS